MSLRHIPGALAAGVVLAIVAGALVAVTLRADAPARLGAADFAAIRFTIVQALISAVLSIALAVPVARALARRRFRGRGAVITLMGAPFLLPVIVAVLGLLAVFGRGGAVSRLAEVLGLPPVDIYGLHGVVLAHVFLNLPLAVRLLLQGWLAIPVERFRLAAALGFSDSDIRRQFERPMLWAQVPGIFMVIFLICTTSFAVALILGGGPRATTIELAIYQAFRFEFDLGSAAQLGLIQVAICAVAGLMVLKFTIPTTAGAGLDRVPQRWDGKGPLARIGDWLAIALACLFLLAPLLAILLGGAAALPGLPTGIWMAALRSTLLAVISAGVALGLALPLAMTMARGRHRGVYEFIGALGIAVSPLVIGTGLFIVLQPLVNPVAVALPVTGLVNALMSLPFLLRALVPAIEEANRTQGRLADALGLSPLQRMRHAILPRLRRPLGFGAGLAAALSMGDLGVIALFSAPAQGTLPMEMFRLMGAYRMDDAQGAAVLLLALTLAVFWIFDRGGRGHAQV